MKRIWTLPLFVLVTASVMSAAGPESGYKAPRTASGHPDLQGVWNFTSGVPLQRPIALASTRLLTKEDSDKRPAATRAALTAVAALAPVEDVGLDLIDTTPLVDDRRTSLIDYPDNGRLPALVEGVRRRPGVEDFIAALAESKNSLPASITSQLAGFGGGKKDSHLDFALAERCVLAAPVPLLPQLGGNIVQIIQGPTDIALVQEFDRRIVRLSGTPGPGDMLRSSSGTSTGHWEGETLVVETRNFDGRRPSFAGAGNSRDKVVTERFTRVSGDRIDYSATIVDSKTFQDRIDLSFQMAQVDGQVYEAGCHEGNYSLRNTLSGARKADEAGSK